MQDIEFAPVSDLDDPALRDTLQTTLDRKTKPVGSLGRLEGIALRIGLILRTAAPVLESPQMLVCAGDHGLVKRGVSAYPQDVTWQMVENYLAGGAAVSVIARQNGIALSVADCGVAHDFAPRDQLLVRKVGYGTADCTQGPAMTDDQCALAIRNGQTLVQALPGNALMLGEMGIGNTTAASALASVLGRLPLADLVGAGTGLDALRMAGKQQVIARALALHGEAIDTAGTPALEALRRIGGLEMAALSAAMIAAAQRGVPVLVDGFIVTAAALAAVRINPSLRPWLLFSHRSAERGHACMLDSLHAEPLLQLELRLGEGSGAAVALPLLRLACALHNGMATFAEAAVAQRSDAP